MPGPDDLYPPAQYGGGWLLLAFGVIAAVILVAVLVLLSTRPIRPKARQEAEAPPSWQVVAAMRSEYLATIDRIADDAATGRMDQRAANRALSAVVRRFVNEYNGYEAPVLSLEDLERSGVPPMLTAAMRTHWYPAIFHRMPVAADASASAAAARTVVTTWH